MDCYGGQQSDDKQWGNAGSNNGSVDVTFPISFTKAVYQIQLTYNNNSYENPTYKIKDTKSFSYWSKYGGDKLWLAIGAQQWGVVTEEVTATLFPLAFTVTCTSVVMTAVSASCAGGWTAPINTQNITTTSFALRTRSNWVSGDTARYIAVGY